MSNYNKVILMGNLTRDPELRYLTGGGKIAKLGIAVNRRYTDRDGQTREEATFVDVDFFGRQAEVIHEYLKKGAALFIEGRLKLDTWKDQTTGEPRQRLSVVGERFQFVNGPRQESGGPPGRSEASQDAEDDNVPF